MAPIFFGESEMTDETTVENPPIEPPADPYAEGTVHEYASLRAPNLRTRVSIGKEDHEVQFVRGAVKVDGPVAREMDRCIERQIGGLYQHVRKMDRAAAIAIATAHAAGIRNAAAKGGMTSKTVQDMRAEAFRASSHQLAEAAPNNPEELAKFSEELAHGDMLVTELKNSAIGEVKVDTPPAKPNLFSGTLGRK